MPNDDPFFSPQTDDKTIIRPVPGGKRSDLQPATSTSPPQAQQQPGIVSPLRRLGGLNALEKTSSGLLALLTHINSSRRQTDPLELKNKIVREIQQFQVMAQSSGVDPQTVSSARYVLCTVLDEAVLNTPWGNDSGWAQQSLLSMFHKEVSGGERFFHLLKSLAQVPEKNRDLLELMYLCLALGFEGRYRLIEDGKNKLVNIKEWLYQILLQEKGGGAQELSPHWQGVTDRRNPLMRLVPLWVFGAAAAGILAVMYSLFLFQLNNDSDPVFSQLNSIKPPVPTFVVAEPEPSYTPVPELTLTMLLADEIDAKRLKVVDLAQRSTITIQGDNLFASGSTTVNRDIIPLLHRIADALNQLPGEVLITGHTDNVPIHSSRFPSNWHLSKARAEAVAEVIKQNLTVPDRTTIEGRSDLDPIASNKTREGRAKNRRVEITLLK